MAFIYEIVKDPRFKLFSRMYHSKGRCTDLLSGRTDVQLKAIIYMVIFEMKPTSYTISETKQSHPAVLGTLAMLKRWADSPYTYRVMFGDGPYQMIQNAHEFSLREMGVNQRRERGEKL